MASLMPSGKQQYFDNNGDPLAGGKLYTYQAGTSTPLATYSDAAGLTPNTNPVILNARGEANVFWSSDSYKVVLKTSSDVELWTQDNVQPSVGADDYIAAINERVPEIGTYAALRAYTGPVTAYYVRGVASLFDGGAGVFRVDAADLVSADNNMTILVDAAGRRWKREYVGDVLAAWAGIKSDGTDQTAAINSATSTLGTAGFRGVVVIPAGTKFNPTSVFAALPDGVGLDITDTLNWGQPPSYKNKFKILFYGDKVADDTQQIIGSGHHPALMLLNMGTAGSSAASSRYATILHGVGRDSDGDPLLGWLSQYAKDPSTTRWRISHRLQTPYSVAIANPQPWVTATVYSAGAYVTSDNGKVYKTTAGGTSGVTAPTGTGTGINDGGVLWDYVQAALNIDSTRWDLDEAGNTGQYGSAAVRHTMQGGSRSHYFEIDPATNDVIWRDASRGRDILRVSTTLGTQIAGVRSLPFTNITGATPTLTSSASYLTQSGPTTVTNFVLPTGQTHGFLLVLFGDGNTTINHGGNFVLKGAANVTPASGAMIEFVKYPSHSGAWIEKSRSF